MQGMEAWNAFSSLSLALVFYNHQGDGIPLASFICLFSGFANLWPFQQQWAPASSAGPRTGFTAVSWNFYRPPTRPALRFWRRE